ncbi:MAG: hypothetical protein RLZ12_307 [Bacillota bacterium]|jgi:type II secretory pathway component PulF
MLFSKQLSLLVASGLSLTASLQIIRQHHILNQRLVVRLILALEHGSLFSEALVAEKAPLIFISFIRLAEAKGDYLYGLKAAEAYFASSSKFAANLKRVCLYPCLVLGLACCSFLFMLVVVLPQFSDLYYSFGIKLPTITIVLLKFFNLFDKYRLLIAALVSMIAVLIVLGYKLAHKHLLPVLLRLSSVRRWIGYYTTYIIALQLGTLLEAGVSLHKGLRLLAQNLSRKYLKTYVSVIYKHVQQGKLLSVALAQTPLAASLEELRQVVALGEKTGRLASILIDTSSNMQELIELKLKRLIEILEPLLICLVGLLVALMVLALFLPVLELSRVL